MYKILLAMFLVLASCADVPTEEDYELDSIEQATEVLPLIQNIYIKGWPRAGFVDSYATAFRTGPGDAGPYSLPHIRYKKSGAFNSCVFGTPGDKHGMWCDGVWYNCPTDGAFTEADFYVWNNGVVGQPNWGWDSVTGGYRMRSFYNIPHHYYSSVRGPIEVIGAGVNSNQKTFVCTFAIGSMSLVGSNSGVQW